MHEKNFSASQLLWVFIVFLMVYFAIGMPALLNRAGANDHDSGTTGIVSWQIARGNSIPVFYPGKNYIGMLLPTLASVPTAILGNGPDWQRIINICSLAAAAFFVFLIFRRLAGSTAAAAISLLLAIPPHEVFNYQKFVEFTGIAVLGVILLYLTARIATSALPSWHLFALSGLVTGLGCWNHPLMISFLLTAILFLLLFNRKALLSVRLLPAIPAMLIGYLPALLHFFNNPALPAPGNSSASPGYDLLPALANAGGHLLVYLGVLGGRFHAGPGHQLLPVWLQVIAAAFFVLVVASLVVTALSRKAGSGRRQAAALVLLLIFSSLLVFLVTPYSQPGKTSARYLFPLALAVPVATGLAGAFFWEKSRSAGLLLLAACLSVFIYSYSTRLDVIAEKQSQYDTLAASLHSHGITGINAPRWRSYWLEYASAGKLRSAAIFPFGEEAWPAHRLTALKGSGRWAWLMADGFYGEGAEEDVAARLEALGVGVETIDHPLGRLVVPRGSSAQLDSLNPVALAQIGRKQFRARLKSTSLSSLKRGRLEFSIINIAVENSGSASWAHSSTNSMVDLVLKSNGKPAQLQVVPLVSETAPGEIHLWRLFSERAQLDDEVEIMVRVNEVPILQRRVELAESEPEATTISWGEPGFIGGWSQASQQGKRIRAVSSGNESTIQFLIEEPVAHRLELSLRQLPVLEIGGQRISFYCNGSAVSLNTVLEGKANFSLLLEAGQLKPGLNNLEITAGPIEPVISVEQDKRFMTVKPRGFVLTGWQLTVR